MAKKTTRPPKKKPPTDRVMVFVNGILTRPGAASNWNANATTFCILYRKKFAEYLEYLSLPSISRQLFQGLRAGKLRRKMQRFFLEGWEVVLIGHSSGADVILDAQRDMDWPLVPEIHLISAACEEDFNKNGLNKALRENKVEKVFIYIAGRDRWLWIVDLLSSWLILKISRFFGYGTLGRTGPVNLDPSVADRVTIIHRHEYGHSSWFSENNFADTMALILREHPETMEKNE